MRKVVRCYAEGRGDRWEALCLDFDLAVQGRSFEEVYASLREAILIYLETVADLPNGADQRRLLNRSAPLSVRFKFFLVVLKALFNGDGDSNHKERAEFIMPCPA